MSVAQRKRIALAIGDPNGIGPEIAIKAARALAPDETIELVLIGDAIVLRSYAERFAPDLAIHTFTGTPSPAKGLTFFHVDVLSHDAFSPGTANAAAGRATVEYVAAATELFKAQRVSAIVACPHSETSVNAAGIPFAGYPGLVARLMDVPEDQVFLLLVGGGLRIAHVTLHERLQSALSRLTPTLVAQAASAAEATLRRLGIAQPHIGVFGINPHAGEGGLFGDDDERITVPAVEALKRSGLHVEGPSGADLMLGRTDMDAFLAMYHDQGHIPVKLMAGRDSAAMTIGPDLMFASVGHGSAFDIAGRGVADPRALLRSLALVSGKKSFGTHAGRP
jgi:4-hydroxy-L-threonine phosphate dehydrogenase PdxA